MNEHEGIMEQIRNALMGGAKPKDLVAKGFPKSTVYAIADKLKKAPPNPANEKPKDPSAQSLPAKTDERRVPPEFPMVTVPLSPKQGWSPTSPKGIKWIFIGSFHVTSEVINLYNFWLDEINPDIAFDEFVSEAVKGFCQLNGIVPAVYVEGRGYGAAGVQSEPAITTLGEKRVDSPKGDQSDS